MKLLEDILTVKVIFPLFVLSLFIAILGIEYDDKLAMAQIQNQSNITIVKNTTIQNATDPGLTINSNTNNIYVVFHRANNGSTNLYMTSSSDNGSSFSQPKRVNDKEGMQTFLGIRHLSDLVLIMRYL